MLRLWTILGVLWFHHVHPKELPFSLSWSCWSCLVFDNEIKVVSFVLKKEGIWLLIACLINFVESLRWQGGSGHLDSSKPQQPSTTQTKHRRVMTISCHTEQTHYKIDEKMCVWRRLCKMTKSKEQHALLNQRICTYTYTKLP